MKTIQQYSDHYMLDKHRFDMIVYFPNNKYIWTYQNQLLSVQMLIVVILTMMIHICLCCTNFQTQLGNAAASSQLLVSIMFNDHT